MLLLYTVRKTTLTNLLINYLLFLIRTNKRKLRRSSGSTDYNSYSLYDEDRKTSVKKNHSDSVVSAGYEDPVDSVLPSAAEKKPALVQPARIFIQDFPQCIDTNSYSEPVNAICQPAAGKSITVHASRKAKKPLTPPSVYTRINPSTREPCSQYMTTASSSPGSAAPYCYDTHYTQLLSAAGQQDTAGNQYTSVRRPAKVTTSGRTVPHYSIPQIWKIIRA